jgi:hypothetical protein
MESLMKYIPKKRLPSFEQLQSYGRKGVEKRREQWKPIKDLAVKLAREGRFATRHEAGRVIAKPVVDFAASRGVKMSDSEAPDTIAGWLKKAGVTFSNDR